MTSWASVLTLLATAAFYFLLEFFIEVYFNPLYKLTGPPLRTWFGDHMPMVLDPHYSPRSHQELAKRYGRNMRIRGVHPFDERLFTLDPVSISHVLKNSTIYEKPWQSRRIITGLIGCGMLAAEGHVHKRQRRVATPAFSIQNMRALVPLVFRKGEELKDKWMSMVSETELAGNSKSVKLDVAHWVSRATFDVIGLAGFDYQFNAIQNESNELFHAYKEMFEIAISQTKPLRSLLGVYAPLIYTIFPDDVARTVARCQEVIHRIAGHLVQEKKKKLAESEKSGTSYNGKDLLTLLLKSNVATDLPPEQRISDDDILHNINTFMFAGSDTTSLAVSWTLYLLAQNPTIQTRLRAELLSIAPTSTASLTADEIQSLYDTISNLPLLHNVSRESLRLIPPVHSSLRVATQDDDVPTSYPVHLRDGTILPAGAPIKIGKGSFVHVPVEAFNLDKEVWGDDAWGFNPDRWDALPEAVAAQPGIFSNTLTFSAGPRSCIGMRFSMIEMKSFLFLLVKNFVFAPTEDKIVKQNVVLTRPYVVGKRKEGSQCPLLITLWTGSEGT